MKILITGANGFIGKSLMKRFIQEDYNVIGWDRAAIENQNIKVKRVDLGKIDNIEFELPKVQPDIIIHCAGSADVKKSVQQPEIDYYGNVTLTHNLLFTLHSLNMYSTKVIFLSSAAVYGNPVLLPIKEDSPLNPLSPYALHKVMCEDICRYFVHNYNMDIKIARIFSAYGAGLRKQIFWDMYSKYKATGRLDMFGTGDESRDYIHVYDVIQALYLLAIKKTDHIICNIANGEEVTIRQAVEYFAKCAGIPKNKISFNGHVREGDPLNWKADISELKRLGYKKHVEMKNGLQNYFDWVKCQ